MRPSILLMIVVGVLLSGCGGGSQNAALAGTPHATFQVAWPDRSRVPVAASLSSALSAVIRFEASAVDRSDVTIVVDRDASKPSAHTETYAVGQTLYPHSPTVEVDFYSDSGGRGLLVGSAASTFTLGSSQVNIATFTVVGTIKTLSVLIPKPLIVGAPAIQLEASAMDANGQAVGVSPGSFTWKVVDGTVSLSVTPDGIATALAGGSASVQVVADGLTSPMQKLLLQPTLKRFKVTDIGWQGSAAILAQGINNSGEVCGSCPVDGHWHAFLYSGGTFHIANSDPTTTAYGWGMNDLGQVTGVLQSMNGHMSAYVYSNDVLTDLGTFGATWAGGDQINNKGWIGGASSLGPFYTHNGEVTFLKSPSGEAVQGYVTGITDSGIMCGAAILGGPGIYHAYIFRNGQMTDVGSFDGKLIYIMAMNQAGHLVGGCGDITNNGRALFYDGTTFTDIGTLKNSDTILSRATGINLFDQIVGFTIDSSNNVHSCIWINGAAVDLSTLVDDTLGLVFLSAVGINDKGQILIQAATPIPGATRKDHILILTPVN